MSVLPHDLDTPEGITRRALRSAERAAATERAAREQETLAIMRAALNNIPGWSEPLDKEPVREISAEDKAHILKLFAEFTAWCSREGLRSLSTDIGPAIGTYQIEYAGEHGLPAAEAAVDAIKMMHFAAHKNDPTEDQDVRKASRFLSDLHARFATTETTDENQN